MFAATSFGGSDFIWVQRKQLKWGRTAVQAERPSSVGFCVGECRHHMHSNSSIRCLVFPDRICLRVLYLSRPARMLSAWMMSFAVFLLSSRALASSELKAWKEGYKYYKLQLTCATRCVMSWCFTHVLASTSKSLNWLKIDILLTYFCFLKPVFQRDSDLNEGITLTWINLIILL